jgi:flagellar basal-body rod protein FlgB
MINDIFKHADVIKRGLDTAWTRNEVLANNIANVDTPGFKRSDVDFGSILEAEQDLNNGLKTTRERHYSMEGNYDSNVKVIQDNSSTMRMDGNNVDIENEAAELAKNTIWYNYMVQKISKDFGRIKTAINEGK